MSRIEQVSLAETTNSILLLLSESRRGDGACRLALECSDDPALGVDVERPARDDRQARIAGRIKDGNIGRRDNLMTDYPIRLRLTPDAYEDYVAGGEVIEV